MKKHIFKKNVNSKNIYGAVWEPDTQSKAVIVFIHGIGEHIERYNSWFNKFCDQGFAIVAADHHGHGRSDGKRGHFKTYNETFTFVDFIVKYTKSEFKDIPIFIYGHSMGGNIVLNYTLRTQEKLNASIVTSPWIILVHPPNVISRLLAKLFYKIFPALTFKTGIKRSQMTDNESELDKLSNDDYIHGKITLSSYIGLSNAAKYALKNATDLKIPTLILHSKSDAIADFNGPKEICKKNPNMVELRLYENFQHELHNEVDNDIVFDEIINFLNQKLADN